MALVDVPRLDLGRRRTLFELLRTTLDVYRVHAGTLLAVTGSIVFVLDVIVGLGLKQITTRYQAHPRQSVATIEVLVSLFVLTPLVNAAYARVLLDLADGRAPRARRAIQSALDVFAQVLLVVVMYAAAVFLGSFLLFPGIYIAIVWYFAVQAVVIEGKRSTAALGRSAQLVSGNWFRVLGIVIVISLIGLAPGVALSYAADAAARAADAQVVSLVGTMLVQIVSLSFISVAATLLFFDLRAASPTGVL